MKRVLQDRAGELPLSVKRTAGDSLDTLCREYTDNGVPVILWATIGMEAPQRSDSFLIEGTGEYFTWIYPMHCLLLTGRDDTGYYFNDPLKGKTVRYSKYAVERAYQGLGRQAVVMLPWQ